jgi:hypothetical protein
VSQRTLILIQDEQRWDIADRPSSPLTK